MQVTRISAACRVVVQRIWRIRRKPSSATIFQLRIQFERRDGGHLEQVLRTVKVRGVDGEAPVGGQNAPTGACKTAPNQNAVSHTVHNPSSFLFAGKNHSC